MLHLKTEDDWRVFWREIHLSFSNMTMADGETEQRFYAATILKAMANASRSLPWWANLWPWAYRAAELPMTYRLGAVSFDVTLKVRVRPRSVKIRVGIRGNLDLPAAQKILDRATSVFGWAFAELNRIKEETV